MGYFEEALSDFVQNFAYGDAIRHLVDRGYTAERIEREFQYPISRERLEKLVDSYQREKASRTPSGSADEDQIEPMDRK